MVMFVALRKQAGEANYRGFTKQLYRATLAHIKTCLWYLLKTYTEHGISYRRISTLSTRSVGHELFVNFSCSVITSVENNSKAIAHSLLKQTYNIVSHSHKQVQFTQNLILFVFLVSYDCLFHVFIYGNK